MASQATSALRQMALAQEDERRRAARRPSSLRPTPLAAGAAHASANGEFWETDSEDSSSEPGDETISRRALQQTVERVTDTNRGLQQRVAELEVALRQETHRYKLLENQDRRAVEGLGHHLALKTAHKEHQRTAGKMQSLLQGANERVKELETAGEKVLAVGREEKKKKKKEKIGGEMGKALEQFEKVLRGE